MRNYAGNLAGSHRAISLHNPPEIYALAAYLDTGASIWLSIHA